MSRRRAAGALALGWLAAATAGAEVGDEAGDAERGAAFFGLHCVSCHGVDGRGDGEVGRWLARPPPPLFAASPRIDADGDGRGGSREDLRRVLLDGAARYGGSRLMAPYPALREDPATLADVLSYLEQRTGR